MTAPIDAAFVAAVRAALDEEVRSVVKEAGEDAWQHLEHRQLAERIKALVAAWHGASDATERAEAAGRLGHAVRLAGRLRELQGPSGLFAGGDNVDSPPDSAFSINDLADALLLLRHTGGRPDSAPPAATPASPSPTSTGLPHPGGTSTGGAPTWAARSQHSTTTTHTTADSTTVLGAEVRESTARPDAAADSAPGRGFGGQEPTTAPNATASDPAWEDGNQHPTTTTHTGGGRVWGVGALGADALRLVGLLEELLAEATPALLRGGVHTPNHRWELSAALARLHRLRPQPALAARVDEWLAEGVDIDQDGLYSERSANYAAYVSNPSLLTIADVFDRPELADAVERNLDATLDLLLPDGSVETVLSRRQDQQHAIRLAPYLLPLRRMAHRRGRGDLAWAAELALGQGIALPAEAATRMALDPGIALALPAAVPPDRRRRRVFGTAGLLMDHRPSGTAVVFGGSDYARHGRIRSGLANSPTFLRLFAGAAVLDSVRLSRTFFGLGPFRSDRLVVEPDGDATTVTLTETVAASYFQPLAAADRDAGGAYRLGDEGRFSAAMDFGRRPRDEVALTTTIGVRLTGAGVRLAVDIAGAAVPWALELAFRPGGAMTGARPIAGRRWQLDVGSEVRYRVGTESLSVTVVEADDGRGGPLRESGAAPAYHPGEDYQYLGGTDAAGGELLYLAAQAPARLVVDIHPAAPPPSS